MYSNEARQKILSKQTLWNTLLTEKVLVGKCICVVSTLLVEKPFCDGLECPKKQLFEIEGQFVIYTERVGARLNIAARRSTSLRHFFRLTTLGVRINIGMSWKRKRRGQKKRKVTHHCTSQTVQQTTIIRRTNTSC
jgi:hypothetical protein